MTTCLFQKEMNIIYQMVYAKLCVQGQGLNPCILNRDHTIFVDYISKDTHHNFY